MLLHHFKYALKTLFKNRILIFWTFAFPILLGTFFQMAFSDIEKNEQLDIIPIAIVDNQEFQNHGIYKETFQHLSDPDSDDCIFDTVYVSEKKAKQLLENDEIDGYVIFDEKAKVMISSNGINETVLKYVVEEISQSEKLINNVAEYKINQEIKNNPQVLSDVNSLYHKIYEEVLEMTTQDHQAIHDTSSQHLSYTMIEFYTLIAMTCLYGGNLGMTTINQVLANMSSNGKRVAVSPAHKGKIILGSMMASYLTQLIGLGLLFIYTIFVLHVDYGSHLWLIVLLSCVGCLAGLSLGIAIATLFKSNENTKSGVVISVTMFCCFLSGMMGITMKYIIDKNIPIINKLNPANMITDGLYSLYYYQTFDRFYVNVISLLIFSIIMFVMAFWSLRRQRYDSL